VDLGDAVDQIADRGVAGRLDVQVAHHVLKRLPASLWRARRRTPAGCRPSAVGADGLAGEAGDGHDVGVVEAPAAADPRSPTAGQVSL
jgi:hypothetical protein